MQEIRAFDQRVHRVGGFAHAFCLDVGHRLQEQRNRELLEGHEQASQLLPHLGVLVGGGAEFVYQPVIVGTGEVGAQQEIEDLRHIGVRPALGLDFADFGQVPVDDAFDQPGEQVGPGAEVVMKRGAVESNFAGHSRQRGRREPLFEHNLLAGIQDLAAAHGLKTLAAHGGLPG